LLVAGLRADGRTRVIEPIATRDHTERLLRALGVEVLRRDRTVAFEGGQVLQGATLDVPGDFSSAAFFIVLGVLCATKGLTLRNVGINPTRTALIDLLTRMGADIRVRHKDLPEGANSGASEPVADIEVHASKLRAIAVPESIVATCIDELPVFFIAASCAEGETLVRGAHELRVKESDRLAVMDGPNHAWAVAMQTVWDTEADAAAFETAATTALEKSPGVAQVLPGVGGKTRWVLVASDAATASKVAGVTGLGR
jgi:5-enolpyruvylshikimate-3-phosphate synthase